MRPYDSRLVQIFEMQERARLNSLPAIRLYDLLRRSGLTHTEALRAVPRLLAAKATIDEASNDREKHDA